MAKRDGRTAPITPEEAREAVIARDAFGGVSQGARSLGLTRSALHRRLKAAEAMGIVPTGETVASTPDDLPLPAPGRVARYILTSAQNNTGLHPELWRNLTALADHYAARIIVGRIRYNRTEAQVRQEKDDGQADGALWYAAEVEPYVCDARLRLAPGLIWAGDMNALPTAANPLSGLDSFTGAESCIFPHTQIALRSVATVKGERAKFNYTTGAATLKNYIKRKAGLKAEFHHAFAALLVEVDSEGDWFVRQVNADPSGVIYDLDLRARGGKVKPGAYVAAFTPGDIHGVNLDPVIAGAVWGAGGLVDGLRPRVQVLHDLFDMESRSHHNDVFESYRLHIRGRESVEAEVARTAEALAGMVRPWCRTVIVKSNHDEHLDRWVKEADFRRDPVNAAFYLSAAAAKFEAIRSGRDDFDLLQWAICRAGHAPAVTWLARDESFRVAGVEMGLHGDLGPNGSRGSAAGLSRIGAKANIGHSHAAAIFAGCYQAGVSCALDMGYNRGPSNWSHSHIVTYENGKRAIVTHRGAKWRAEGSPEGGSHVVA